MATPSRLAGSFAQRYRNHAAAADDPEALAVLANTPLTELPTRQHLRTEGLSLAARLHASCAALHEGLRHARNEGDVLTDASGSMCTRLRGGHAATDVLLSQTHRLRHELAATERRQALVTAFGRAYALSEEDEALLNAPAGGSAALGDSAPLLAVLDNVKAIRARAAALSAEHPLALQLGVGAAAQTERGYGLLFRWLDAQCRALPVRCPEAQLEPLARAVDALRAQPALLATCADEVAAGRQPQLLARFEAALAEPMEEEGGVGGEAAMLPPLHAALVDLRACLEAEARLFRMMLVASDREGAAMEVGSATDLLVPIASATALLAAPLHRHVHRLLAGASLDTVHAAGSRLSLSHRVLTVLHEHAVALAPLVDTALASAISGGTPPEATQLPEVAAAAANKADDAVASDTPPSNKDEAPPLVVAMRACLALATSEFERSRGALLAHLKGAGALAGGVTSVASSAAPAGDVGEGVAALEMLLDAHEQTSAIRGDDDADETPAAAETQLEASVTDADVAAAARAEALVSEIVGVVLANCKAAASGRGTLPLPLVGGSPAFGGPLARLARPGGSTGASDAERLIWLLNSIETLRGTLAVRLSAGGGTDVAAAAATLQSPVAGVAAVVEGSLRLLTAELNGLLDELAREAAQDVLHSCGLSAKLAALQTAEAQSSVAMAEMVGLEPLALSSVMRSFYGVLFRKGDALLAHAELIVSPSLRRQAATQTARTVASTYQHIHVLISRSGSGYDAPETILLHSPREVEALLGLM